MKRIESLTFLRFVAAILVVSYHFGQEANLGYFKDIFNAFVPPVLTFFFSLSGFVLMISYYERKEFSVKQFYLARMARIAPVYWIALILTAVLRYSRGGNDLIGLVLSATFLQSWVYPYALVYNDVAWAVSVEIFFYLTFPFILYFIRKSKVTPSRFLLIAIAVYVLTQAILIALLNAPSYPGFPSSMYNLINFFPLSHYCSFLLGLAGGMIYLKYRQRVISGFQSYVLLISAFAVTFIVVQFGNDILQPTGVLLPINSSFYAPLFLGLILAIAFTKNRINDALGLRPLAILGAASYSIYILQRPFALAFKFAYKRFHMTPTLSFFILTISLVVLSVLTYYFLEEPAKKLAYKIFAKPSPSKTSS
jgi:peptidoglycan/LPS O-acetylase OafA/YrhL